MTDCDFTVLLMERVLAEESMAKEENHCTDLSWLVSLGTCALSEHGVEEDYALDPGSGISVPIAMCSLLFLFGEQQFPVPCVRFSSCLGGSNKCCQ